MAAPRRRATAKAGAAPRRPRRQRERLLQRLLLDWCARNLRLGVIVMHVPNEDITGTMASVMARKADGVLAGWPDLQLLHQGRLYLLELKEEEGETSEAQDKLHARLRGQGFPVEVAWSLGEAQQIIRGWGLAIAA